MKCFIIGSCVDSKQTKEFKEECIKIGEFLYNNGHSLILCSPFNDSADYWVLKGYSLKKKFDNKQTIEMHFIENSNVLYEIDKIESGFVQKKIIRIPHPGANEKNKSELSYSWLLCQLEALETCDFIITIGGKIDGAAFDCFNRNKYNLADKLGDDYLLLNAGTNILDSNIFNDFLEGSCVKRNNEGRTTIESAKFFISYPRARPEEADYIETLLRRRKIDVFRDESAFGAGSSIPQNIIEAIYSSNIFIAVWCAEYACSPWCFDEFELALDRKEKGLMDLWIICLDGIRIVPKRARNLIHYDVTSRDDIEGRILKLLETI